MERHGKAEEGEPKRINEVNIFLLQGDPPKVSRLEEYGEGSTGTVEYIKICYLTSNMCLGTFCITQNHACSPEATLSCSRQT